VLASLFTGLLPLVCPGCGRRGDPVCGACAGNLQRARPADAPPGLDAWWAAFAYEGVAREVVARVKYRGARAALPWLADAMVEVLPATATASRFDAVTWAPTSRERRRSRGFDPAELLARAVARRLGVRCVGLLDRGPGPPQTGRTGADRRHGPEHVAHRAVPPSVLVVDDVATTGATLAAAARALRAGGAQRAAALTAARTPPPETSPPRTAPPSRS
jgi:predicted amidophosphoribosyltransferase